MGKASGIESLLRWRGTLERAAELALKKAVVDVNHAKRELEGIEAERHGLRVALNARLREGSSTEVLQLYSGAALEAMERGVRERLRFLLAERLRAEARYAECRRDRKVIENMGKRRGAQERMEALRREQVRIDEATMRRLGKQSAESSIGRSE